MLNFPQTWLARYLVAACMIVTAVAAVALSTVGCASTVPGDNRTGSTTQPIKAVILDAPRKSGSQLWAETCTRCHNARPPQYYSDAQWDVIVHHMRLRANLTGEEQREITKFLQAAN